jgi:hypothetical protein
MTGSAHDLHVHPWLIMGRSGWGVGAAQAGD